MLKNKAQIARESIKNPAFSFVLLICVRAHVIIYCAPSPQMKLLDPPLYVNR